MVLFILAYVGGLLTIFSPCVLPVIPFLFSRAHLSFRRSGLPTLVGMGLSFTAFGVLSAAGGSWVIHANEYGRILAMVIFAVLGLSLIFSSIAQKLMQPLVNLGGRLQQKANGSDSVASSLLVGASVGLLWAPCAGPILGLVLAGAAIGGLNESTFALLGCFALGAATSLAVAILASGKVLQKIKKGLGAEEWLKKGLGVLVLVSVAAIALGLDTKLLAKFSYLNTNGIEQKLIDLGSATPSAAPSHDLQNEGVMPSLAGADAWLNSKPLTPDDLKGKVVLVDFWTYSCINCLRTLPYLKAWSEKYAAQGLVVIGVHAPEFAFEKKLGNVESAVKDLNITYPVAIDNQLKIWSAFKNQYWPAHYLVDAKGVVRSHHFGEGGYEESELLIQKLLQEAHPELKFGTTITADVKGEGLEMKHGAVQDIGTPETYLGYDRQENFVSAPRLEKDSVKTYKAAGDLALKQWDLDGKWLISPEMIASSSTGASIVLKSKARDVHLVLGNPNGKPVHYRVTLDGKAPAASHGDDIDAKGEGEITSQRLYQLIRQVDGHAEHVFEIEFLDAGAEAFAFTFG